MSRQEASVRAPMSTMASTVVGPIIRIAFAWRVTAAPGVHARTSAFGGSTSETPAKRPVSGSFPNRE